MDCKLRAKNCGGCPMLATEYAAQLKKKEADVRALLGKYGPVAPIRGMETPYHYRNKVISTFAPAAGGKLTSGIYAARTHKVLPVESCLLQDEVLDKVMLAVRAAPASFWARTKKSSTARASSSTPSAARPTPSAPAASIR